MDEALKKTQAEGHSVQHVLVYDNKNAAKREEVAFVAGRDAWWDEAVGPQPEECEPEWLDAEAPLFKVP